MQKPKKLTNIELILGIFLIILSFVLAIGFKFTNFYFVLVFGMFLLVYSIYNRLDTPLKSNLLARMYLSYFVIAVIGDLLGIIFKLWSYPNYVFLDYVVLYSFVYPIAGLCMLYTFLIFENLFFKNKIKSAKPKYTPAIVFLIASILFFSLGIFVKTIYNFYFCSAIILFIIFLKDILIIKIKNYSYLSEVFKNLKIYLILFLLTAYIQGIIHEFPNHYANEWAYSGFPLMNITFLNIPIFILFVGWIVLIFTPHMLYKINIYFINRNKL